MAILIDTNVLLRSTQPEHPMSAIAIRALAILMEREEPLVVAIQIVAEFWNTATRPEANNGLGFSIEEARNELAKSHPLLALRLQRRTRIAEHHQRDLR